MGSGKSKLQGGDTSPQRDGRDSPPVPHPPSTGFNVSRHATGIANVPLTPGSPLDQARQASRRIWPNPTTITEARPADELISEYKALSVLISPPGSTIDTDKLASILNEDAQRKEVSISDRLPASKINDALKAFDAEIVQMTKKHEEMTYKLSGQNAYGQVAVDPVLDNKHTSLGSKIEELYNQRRRYFKALQELDRNNKLSPNDRSYYDQHRNDEDLREEFDENV